MSEGAHAKAPRSGGFLPGSSVAIGMLLLLLPWGTKSVEGVLSDGTPNGLSAVTSPDPPESSYWIYVLAESADRMHRIRYGPEGAVVEKTTPIGHIPVTMEGPHGIQISRDGRYLYMTTGHGNPDGKFWKYQTEVDTVLAGPIDLGSFPATVDVTPDGLYGLVGNFNLHGAMVPSTISIVYLPTFQEVEQTETCTMPHGSRVTSDGRSHYSVCMMDDQLVEISLLDFAVSRRFSLTQGAEEPMALGGRPSVEQAGHAGHHVQGGGVGGMHEPTCTPTWATPTPSGDRIFVACNATDEILEIDRAEWRLLRRIPAGRGPYNLEVTADERVLIVTLKQGHGVEFIDIEQGNRIVRSASSSTLTHGVVSSPDGRYAFVTVEGVRGDPGKVDIYDLGTFERVAEVEVGQQAAGIAFWKMAPADR